MSSDAIQSDAPTLRSILEAEPARTPPLLERQQSFAESLGRAFTTPTADSTEAQIRRAAEQLVSAALVTPLLSQLRNSSQAAPPFAPTEGEKQFRALSDSKVAHDIVRGSNLPIVERITSDMLRHARALEQVSDTERGASIDVVAGGGA